MYIECNFVCTLSDSKIKYKLTKVAKDATAVFYHSVNIFKFSNTVKLGFQNLGVIFGLI